MREWHYAVSLHRIYSMLPDSMSNKCYYAFIVLCICLVSSKSMVSQYDTLYVKSYYNSLVPRLLMNYKNQSTSFVTKSDTLHSVDYFATGPQLFVGAEVSYKWASLGYNFGFNKETSSANTDLRFSASYKPMRLQTNYTVLKNLNYYRVNGAQQSDTVFMSRQHTISVQNIGLKVDYIFNYKTFYYSSSISQIGHQLKSKGSFMISTGVSYQDFDLRGISDSTGLKFVERYHIDHFKTIRADLGLGYAYNWVLSKHWVFYLSEIPNIGIQQTTGSDTAHSGYNSTVSLTNYARAGITYTWENLFIGMYAYNALTTSKWSSFNYNNVYTSLQLHVGLVMDDPKKHIHKIRQ